jgi:hypothetical protein
MKYSRFLLPYRFTFALARPSCPCPLRDVRRVRKRQPFLGSTGSREDGDRGQQGAHRVRLVEAPSCAMSHDRHLTIIWVCREALSEAKDFSTRWFTHELATNQQNPHGLSLAQPRHAPNASDWAMPRPRDATLQHLQQALSSSRSGVRQDSAAL